jgi:hypothetical protein
MTLTECIKGKVKFKFYRTNDLYYECENGFVFKVPTSDTNDAVFLSEDKGILFMRWIRKALDELKDVKTE